MFARVIGRASSLRSRAIKTATFGIGVAAVGWVGCHGTHHHHHHDDHHDHDHQNAFDRLERLKREVAQLQQDAQAALRAYEESHQFTPYSGQGDMVFSWSRELTAAFPEDAKQFEKDMHGGFSEDPQTGVVYTGIPGYGLCTISPDLKTWTTVGNDPRLKDNIHGIVVFNHKGQTRVALAQNEHERVLIVDTDGQVVQELGQPKGGEFSYDEANAYYSNRPRRQLPWDKPHTPAFAVTDVTFLDGLLYAVAGYCEGDFVVTAREEDGKFVWGPLAWGGKGNAPGKFQTAHGIFAHNDHIYVANREAHQVIEFTKTGQLVRCLPDIPESARICNVARSDNYFIMNALEPIQHTPAKTASIYAHTGEHLASTIQPGELGVPILKHLHHTWPHYVTNPDGSRTLHLLLHGWSAGKYAVLKHEPEAQAVPPNGWDRAQDPLK